MTAMGVAVIAGVATVTEREYAVLVREKENFVEERIRYVAPIMAAIAFKWAAILEPGATQILTWLVGRTLSLGRLADSIPYREFIEDVKKGADEPKFCPLRMTMPTLKKHLGWLTGNGFLHVYSIRSMRNGSENSPRMFEINCKKLISEGVPPLKNLGGSSYIYTYISFTDSFSFDGLAKANLLSPAFGAARVADPKTKQGVDVGGNVLAEPKKRRAAPDREDSIAGVVASATKTSMARRAGRAAAAPVEINCKNLQALIDVNMREYLPMVPRVIVTQKPLSVFAKRIKAANIDLAKFVTFMIREWSSIALQNRAAFNRDLSKARKGTPLPLVPDFNSMAYRLPYFITAYGNSMVTGTVGAAQDAKDQEIARLKAQLSNANKEAATVRQILRRKAASTSPQRPAAKPSPELRQALSNLLNDDWTPPKWEEGSEGNHGK